MEGEVVPVAGVEDGVGSDAEGALPPIQSELDFIRETGIYCYAPPIGTAHGFYKAAPTTRSDRMQQLDESRGILMVPRGGAKVNISTALKKTYADGFGTYLEQHPTQYDPLKLIGAVRNDVIEMARSLFRVFGSEGQA